MKNTKQKSGKCKTTIQVDSEQVFISGSYEWEHPNSKRNESKVNTGRSWGNKGLKASIKNISITSNATPLAANAAIQGEL